MTWCHGTSPRGDEPPQGARGGHLPSGVGCGEEVAELLLADGSDLPESRRLLLADACRQATGAQAAMALPTDARAAARDDSLEQPTEGSFYLQSEGGQPCQHVERCALRACDGDPGSDRLA